MTIIGSCGHTFTDSDGMGYDIAVPYECREGSPCICYICVCKKCYEWYEKNGLIIEKEQRYDVFQENQTC